MRLFFSLVTSGLLLAFNACAQSQPSHPTSFSPALDRQIAQAYAAASAPCDLQQAAPGPAGGSAWSAWQTDYCRLAGFLVDPAHPALGSYPVPVRLPSEAGRQLFLAGGSPVVLLEFEPNRFRFIELGTDDFGATPSVSHRFYAQPGGGLLQIRNSTGSIGKAGGATATWLSMLDVAQGKWVLADLLIGVEEDFSRTTHSSQVDRSYQVQDAGKTLVLGNYRLNGGAYKYAHLPAAVSKPEDATADWPAGTYQLLGGHYQRAPSGASAPPAPKPGRRLAVGAAEVNGTFRDARGHEFTLLAVGAGKVQVAYQPHPTPAGSQLLPTGQAVIRADSALYTAQAGGCPLRFYFVQKGTLLVQAPGCPEQARASMAGTYQKVSSTKPLLSH